MERGDEHKKRIRNFYRRHKRMPSYGELADTLGFSSKNAAYELVGKLSREGFVSKDKSGRIIPGNTMNEVKVLGVVEAGFPSAAEEELLDTMSLDEYLIGNPEGTYIVRVKGYSMKDAGILPGDMVLVERTSEARDGEIVIAEVDGEWTMKYLRRHGRRVELVPANSSFRVIIPQEELKVAAVVRAVIRKYYN